LELYRAAFDTQYVVFIFGRALTPKGKSLNALKTELILLSNKNWWSI
jgi:hypothetical protein